jgi:DNA (cytosine-5)-methyltransferase 1
MNHGSLFSGIGGFDLAAEWMGWENVFHCEWNPFGQKVLKHYWPNSISYNDITKTDFTIHRGSIDILTGGFPCQPYSSAGKRLGKEDERHLWPEMLRAIREIQPRWIVGENVLGLVNWNGGMVFEEVQADLEAEGYEVQPYVLPAAAVNAPHRRDRVWFVAYATCARNRQQQRTNSKQQNRQFAYNGENGDASNPSSDGFNDKPPTTNNIIRQDNIESGTQRERAIKGLSNEWNATDTNGNGLNQCNSDNEVNTSQGRVNALSNAYTGNDYGHATDTERIRLEHSTDTGKVSGKETNAKREWNQSALPVKTNGNGYKSNWDNFPTVSPICSRNDGLSNRLDGITFSKWRTESIKAGGNAIVPQVVYQIFKAIELYGIQNTSQH